MKTPFRVASVLALLFVVGNAIAGGALGTSVPNSTGNGGSVDGGLTGTGVANELAVWNGVSSLGALPEVGAVAGQVLTYVASGSKPTWQTAAGISGLTSPRIPYAASATSLADDAWHLRSVTTAAAPGNGTVTQVFIGDGTRQGVTPNQDGFNYNYSTGLQLQSDTVSSPMLVMIKGSGGGGGAYQDFPRIRMRAEPTNFSTLSPSDQYEPMGDLAWETRWGTSATNINYGGYVRGFATDQQTSADKGLSVVVASTPANAAFGGYALSTGTPYTNIVASGRGTVLQAVNNANPGFYRWVPWFGATAGVSGGTADPGAGSFSVVKYASTGTTPPGAATIYLGSAVPGNNFGINNYNAGAQQMTRTVDGQLLGTVQSMGWYHDNYNTYSGTGSISFQAAGNWSINTNVGSRILFRTNPNPGWFTGGVTTIMTEDGGLDVGTNLITSGTAQFRVSGTGNVTMVDSVIAGTVTTLPSCTTDAHVTKTVKYSKSAGATISLCVCTKAAGVYAWSSGAVVGDCT